MRESGVLVLLVVCSCVPVPLDFNVASPEGLRSEIERPGALSDANTTEAVQQPAELTIDVALKRAWSDHPQMRKARAMIGAERGARIQASLRPNPTLGFSVRDEIDMKDVISLTYGQMFETGGRRRRRTMRASAQEEAARRELLSTWAEVRARVKSSFAAVAYARQSVRLQERLTELREEAAALSESLLAAGKVSRLDILKTRELAAIAQSDLENERLKRDNALRQSGFAVGLPAAGKLPMMVAALETSGRRPQSYDDLLQRAFRQSPQIAAAAARRAVAAAAQDLQRALRFPNVFFSAGVGDMQMESGASHTEIHASVSGELTVFDRNQGNIIESQYLTDAATQSEQAARLSVASALSEMVSKLNANIAQVAAYERTVLPSSEQRRSYAEGQVAADRMSRLEYLEHEISLQQVRMKHLATQYAAAVLDIRIEEIVGIERTLQTVGQP